MVRNVFGVIAGAIVWMAGFFILATLLAQLWPAYGAHAREWTQSKVFTFTALMACCNLLFWFIGEVGAGWTSAKIARQHAAIWVLAILIGGYLATLHLVLFWSSFPWWYNLGVVIPAIPAVILGSKLGKSLARDPLPA
jgi:hypothetical protein